MIIETKSAYDIGLASLTKCFSLEQISIIKKVIRMIINQQLKPGNYKDHALGKAKLGLRDCHPLAEDDPTIDLVILYKVEKRRIVFCNIGTHKEVFD